MKTLYQGVHYDIAESVYHSDPCPKPSLSASIAKWIWQESCQHAWWHHPRLNPDYESDDKYIFDIGNAAHAILLKGDVDGVFVIGFDDYRKKEARVLRDSCLEDGLIPILAKQYDDVVEMVNTAIVFIENTELEDEYYSRESEVTIAEFSDGFWKRCCIDILPIQRGVIIDYKTTQGSSNPSSYIRNHIFPRNMDIQAYAYPKILSDVERIEMPKFVWLVQESKPPYACSLIGASPAVMESGKRKWEYACHKWKWSLEHDEWRGHENQIHWADVPAWQQMETESRGIND